MHLRAGEELTPGSPEGNGLATHHRAGPVGNSVVESLTALEVRAINLVQRASTAGPFPRAANLLSTFGEHSAGWLMLAGVGALAQPTRRSTWAGVALSAFLAHGTAIVVKRIVRRRRPDSTRVVVLDSTPSRLSFPSAHAASTTAAAVSLAPIIGNVPAVAVPVTMGLARVGLGVHYPTDVLAGSAVGWLIGRTTDRVLKRIAQ